MGDFRADVTAHRAVGPALTLAGRDLDLDVQFTWHHTAGLGSNPGLELENASGIWCVPAGPYENTDAALGAIRFARERDRPFLGTCAGFQHALLEYARNVLGRSGAAHAELEPQASDALIAPLSCSLVEEAGTISLVPDSMVAQAYQATQIHEEYHCRYGLSPVHESLFHGGPLRIVGRDPQGEVRAVELTGHPFFAATLFQPERLALRGQTPPLVRAFVNAAARLRPA